MLRERDLTFYPYITSAAIWSGIPDGGADGGADSAPMAWLWTPGEWFTIEGNLETINQLIKAGWERLPNQIEAAVTAYSHLFTLYGQLGDVRGISMPGREVPELWAPSADVQQMQMAPVTLAFGPDALPAGAQPIQRPGTAVWTLHIANVVPPPQFGTVGIIHAGTGPSPTWKRYELSALGTEAQALQGRLSDALRELANDTGWWPLTHLLAACARPGYRPTRDALQSRLLQTHSRTARTEIKAELAALEEANARHKALQVARNWFDPDTWLSRWRDVREMAHELAAAYWAVYTEEAEAARGIVRRQLPLVPYIFGEGQNALVPVASMMPVQTPLLAYSAAQSGTGWVSDSEGLPTYRQTTRDHDTAFQVRANDIEGPPNKEMIQALWQQVREFSDLDGDVFLIMLAQWMSAERDEEDSVWITGGQFLDYRIVQPIMKRDGGSVPRRAGHRQEDLQEIARCVARQSSQWVIIRSKIEDDDEDTAKTKSRARKRRWWTHESSLTQVVEVIRQHEIDLGDETQKQSYAIAWRYKMGTWLKKFLQGPNRKVAWLCQTALHYDPYRETWEKRLARYFMFHLRINAAGHQAAIKRNIGNLIRELSLPIDERNPQRTRDRFEQALDRLKVDGQIDSWSYDSDNRALPARKWLETWLDWNVHIGAAAIVQEHHSQIAAAAQQRRDRAATLHNAKDSHRKQQKGETQ